MKIVIVTDRFDPSGGGLERWTAALVSHLIGQGHEVHVAAFGFAEHELPIRAHLVRSSRSPLMRARRARRCLAGIGADVVHDTGTGWSADVFQPQTGSRLMSFDREIASLPLARRLRAAVAPRLNWRRAEMAVLERGQIRRARRIVAVSRLVRRQLVERHGIARSDIPVIYNGVDTTRFRPDYLPAVRAAQRARLAAGESVLFLAAAHNLRLKGIDTALRALGLLVRAGCDARLAVAGGVPDATFKSLAASLGIADRAMFLGPVERMERLFAAADVFVHPTRQDGCSLATIEALASGVPVITTAANGAAEIMEDGRHGFVLGDPEDNPALAERMRRLLDEPLRRRIGAEARTLALDHDIRDNCRAVEAILVEAARPWRGREVQ